MNEGVPPIVHHGNPPGVSLVNTDLLLLAERPLEYAIDNRLMTAFTGPSGTGKTVTLRALLRDRDDVDVIWIDVPVQPTMRAVARRLAEALEIPHKPREGRHDLTYRLIDALGDRPDGCALLIVLDEAQRLNNECAEYVRYLHDPTSTRFAIALAGGHRCWETIQREPMLESRVHQPVFFRPLTDTGVLQFLSAYHPMYARADPDALLWVNTVSCHGELRRWSGFTAAAADFMNGRAKTLTREIAAFTLNRPDAVAT